MNRHVLRQPAPLPIDPKLPGITQALGAARSLVVVASPGAGKTTRVPPALAAAFAEPAGSRRVLVLEPRRIAARAAAQRMAEEQGWSLGREVGYQVRFDRRYGAGSRIVVLTEGILVQWLQSDPFLEGTAVVVFDEFHERSLATDLSLAMVRRVQREVRPDLRIVGMSATLDAASLADYLGGAAVVEVPMAAHPVEVVYDEKPDARPLEARVAAAVRGAVRESAGDVLAFLPGVGEIRRTQELLAGFDTQGIAVVPLYGDLSAAEQDRALRRGDKRRVVLATNVAETSVTVEGVRAVVDSGLARTLRFDPASGLDALVLGRISRAAADQRAGRAGREGPGICRRLWSEADHRALQAFEKPEIQRADLAGPILQLLAWGERDLENFSWFEAPEPGRVVAARELLEELGAVDRDGVTPLGRRMATLPLPPRIARLLLEGERWGVVEEAAGLAALLSERRAAAGRVESKAGPPVGDLLSEVEASLAAASASRGGLRRVRDQLLEALNRTAEKVPKRRTASAASAGREEALQRSLLAAYPDRVARRRAGDGERAVLAGGRGVRLAPEVARTLADREFFLAVDLDDRGTDAWVRRAAPIEREWLDPGAVREVDEVRFDEEKRRIEAWRVTRYLDLVLEERRLPPPARGTPLAEAGEEALLRAASLHLDEALGLAEPEFAQLLIRWRCLRSWMPELELPEVGEERFRALLTPLVAGARSFADLGAAKARQHLVATLSHAQRTALQREAPERLSLPNGRSARLTYEEDKPPVLAARIQDLFGWSTTPRVAAGRVPVLVQLLAPSGRPQQTTQDLASFWRNTYPQVRKELAGRYPKHAWPVDPTDASAVQASRQRRPRRSG